MAAAASRLATKTDGQDSIRRTGSANTAAAALNPDSSTNSSRRPKTKPGCCPATVRSNEVTTPIATNTRMCANVNITISSRETGIVCRRSASARRRNTTTPRMVGVSNGLPPITSRTRNHTATPAAPRRPAMMPSRYTSGGRAVSLSASPGADGGADAAEVLLDVADEDLLHGLLSGHGRYTLEDAATAVELRVRERANHAGRRGRVFLVQLQGLGLRALGMFARVLRVHLVEHRHRHIRDGLPAGDILDQVGDGRVSHSDVMRRHADRPLLGRRGLAPVRVAQAPKGVGHGLARLLELLREGIRTRSHVILLIVELSNGSIIGPTSTRWQPKARSGPRL